MARGSRKRRLHRESRVRRPAKVLPVLTDPLFWPGAPMTPTVRVNTVKPHWPHYWNQHGWGDPSGCEPLYSSTYVRTVKQEGPDGSQE